MRSRLQLKIRDARLNRQLVRRHQSRKALGVPPLYINVLDFNAAYAKFSSARYDWELPMVRVGAKSRNETRVYKFVEIEG